MEATDTLRRGYWLGLPLDMSNDDDLKASRNALGHSGRRIPHPLSQTRLPTAAKSNSQEMCEHELSAEPTGLAESTSKQIPVRSIMHILVKVLYNQDSGTRMVLIPVRVQILSLGMVA